MAELRVGCLGLLPGLGVVVRGFVLLEERECCVEIAWLAVERSFHGKRIGSLLLGAAGAYACGGGKPMFTVKTYGGWITSPTMKP